ncbi:Ferroportin-1 protein [Dioscorea alata]|uniref:Ferroportin-1 protein n=1 Tax=Dioscorea alata TaxID=55571 RepID=A0ACB7V2W2_DIOAL|nr:Ferroportin-1 protein [Dioscorea alata]
MEDVNMRQPLVHGSSQQSLTLAFIKRMYVGHFLARWGARMWEFSVGLYMINLWPDSLLFTAIYGVVESSSTALFGSFVGKWVDRLTYAKVLKLWLLTQNLSFIVAGVTVTALLTCSSLKSTSFSTFLSFVILVNLSGAIGVLSTLAGTILIEREWVVVIANGQPAGVLTEMNSTIRRIDLICKLLAPVFSGFIISFISLKASAVTLALWNTLSVWLQYWLLTSVYNGIPALISTDEQRKAKPSTSNMLENESYFNENTSFVHLHWWNRIPEMLSKIPFLDAWILYSKQQVVLPGVSLALLYFTVLSFGTLMTATLQWKGIPAYIIGLARGFSAIVGISATMIYPIVHSHISTLRTGLWSIWTQWSFLLLCLASIWIKNNGVSAWMLMGGVAASRLGLWMFDLSVIQQMQDEVPESDRCIVGGAQNSLQSMLDLLTYIMGIIVSNPEEFGKLVIMSFVLVSSAALLYTLHVYQVRKHLFHFEKFLKI